MNRSKLRRQIAWEAARLMYLREESEYFRAKQKAAHRICQGWVKPADLPSNAEIRDEIQSLARLYEGDATYERGLCPVTERMHERELLLLGVVRAPATLSDMDDIADAIEKVLANAGALARPTAS